MTQDWEKVYRYLIVVRKMCGIRPSMWMAVWDINVNNIHDLVVAESERVK